MKLPMLCVFAIVACCGCTTLALKQDTVTQVMSLPEMRSQEILDNLAVLAHNPGVLPSFEVTTQGTTAVATTLGPLDAKSTFDVNGFASQALTLTGKHAPTMQWTIDPVTNKPQLDALHCACLWAIYQGPPPDAGHSIEVLRATTIDDVYPRLTYCVRFDAKLKKKQLVFDLGTVPTPQPHFAVLDRLAALPPNWLGRGSRSDVPKCACRTAHCCGTYVWVTPEATEAFDEFSLIILDIMDADLETITPPSINVALDIQIEPCSCDTTISPPEALAVPQGQSQQQNEQRQQQQLQAAAQAKPTDASKQTTSTVTRNYPVYRYVDPSGKGCDTFYAVVTYNEPPDPCCTDAYASFEPSDQDSPHTAPGSSTGDRTPRYCFVRIPNPSCICGIGPSKGRVAPMTESLDVVPQLPAFPSPRGRAILPGRRDNNRY